MSVGNYALPALHIQNRFFGCILGKSTFSDLVASLSGSYNDLEVINEENILFRGVLFGSYTWDLIAGLHRQFLDGLDFYIEFSLRNFSKPDIYLVYNNIRNILNDKYHHFLVTDEDDYCIFVDDYTGVSLRLFPAKDGSRRLSLFYKFMKECPVSFLDDF